MKRLALLSALGLALAVAPASALEITLPRETAAYAESALPGYALTLAHCSTCHSSEYARTQPPASARAYWQATVVKMQKVFAAPLPDPVVEPIVDYLVKTYGGERLPKPATTTTPSSLQKNP